MRSLLVSGAIVALLAASGGGAANRPYPGTASWADARHGWAPDYGDLRCAQSYGPVNDGNSRLCATEDGGRTWRTIFLGGNYILGLVRTSPQAGIVSTGAYGHFQYWTRDNGGHWFHTQVVGGVGGFNAPGVSYIGRGERLYWNEHATGTVFQVTPWPPTGPAICAGGWTTSITERGPHPQGNICAGPAVEAGMRSVEIVSGHGHLRDWILIPGGLAALFQRDDGRIAVAVRRDDATTVRELPAPTLPESAHGAPQKLRVDGPRIVVDARFFTGDEAKQSWEVTWRSRDGGETWDVVERQSWSWNAQSPIPRAGTAAGVVGDEIVLAGGRARTPVHGPAGTASKLVQAYRPADDTWRRMPDLPVPVRYAAGASSGDALYVVGGYDRRSRPQRRAFVLRNGAWQRLPAPPEPRAAAGAAIVGDKLYVVGGVGRSGLARKALVLNLRSNRWSTAPGPRPRAHLGVAAAGGRIVAIGGRLGRLGTNVALAEGWQPGQARWRRLPPLPAPSSELAAGAYGDAVVALGGAATEHHVPLASAALLSPGASRWQPLQELRTPRYGLSAAVIGRTLYALVGGDGDGATDIGTLNESLPLGP